MSSLLEILPVQSGAKASVDELSASVLHVLSLFDSLTSRGIRQERKESSDPKGDIRGRVQPGHNTKKGWEEGGARA